MRIYKYELQLTDCQLLPIDPKLHVFPLSVAEQNGKLMLWAYVSEVEPPYTCGDDDADGEVVEVTIVGTGNHFDVEKFGEKTFLGTAVMSNSFVWHVFFERVPRYKK